MRARLIFIVVAVVLVGAFTVQNWPEFNRASSLSFGPISMTLSLGLVMLTLLGITLLAFLVSAAAQESRHLLEHRRHTRALQAQRELAEKAEASRFTDLRQHLDTHLRENRQREAIVATEFEKTVMQSQRELRAQIDQLNHMLAGRLTDLEARLTPRATAVEPATIGSEVPVRDRVRL